jgi:manganese/iron transport system permease protein/iron/zinc/copper transport system permease protein
MLTDRLPRMMVLAAVIAVLSVVLGLYFSEWVNASGGGAIMFMGFVLFLLGLLFAPRYGLLAGWLRRRATVPQSDIEDLLKAAYEQRDWRELPIPPARRRRGIRHLVRQGWVAGSTDGPRLALTNRGRQEAAHIERSHQLWEGHFIRDGMPPDDAHRVAEHLEHLHHRQILDDFDDELAHPITDAHGMEIPGEQEADPEDAPVIYLSLLRVGDRARIPAYAPETIPGLNPGAAIELVARNADEQSWTVRTDDRQFVLTHEQADRLVVERLQSLKAQNKGEMQ